MLLHVLAHVDADHRPLVVEEEVGQRAGQLGLADAGGAEEEERADRPVGVGQAGPAAADGVGHRGDGLVLADDPLVEDLLHADELLHLALHEAGDGDAGPLGDDLGDVLLVDLLLEHLLGGLELGEALGGLVDLRARARGSGRSGSRPPSRGRPRARSRPRLASSCSLSVADRGRWPPSRPASGPSSPSDCSCRSASSSSSAASRSAEAASVSLASATRSISSWRMRRSTTSISVGIESISMRSLRRRLVDEVDGLVGQEAAGDVAVGQHGGGDERGVLDADAVVDLVALLEAAEDGDGVLDRGLADEHLLEAALERGVLLDVLAVLVERGGADHAQLAAGQHRLEHVAGVHRALGLARRRRWCAARR